MRVSGAKVTQLIDYINNENPTNYDYPVPNTIALPVDNGNPKYLDWVTHQCSSNDGIIVYDEFQTTK